LPTFDWLANYVLACQRHAVGKRRGRRDQGTTILPYWLNIYAVHVADAAGRRRAPLPAGAPRSGLARANDRHGAAADEAAMPAFLIGKVSAANKPKR
jgi:hypothetical protein